MITDLVNETQWTTSRACRQKGAPYAQGHTRAWSRMVTGTDAFIIVTPQYNWGTPASLKNAMDHL